MHFSDSLTNYINVDYVKGTPVIDPTVSSVGLKKLSRWRLENMTASSSGVCQYFCSMEDMSMCQAALFFVPDKCSFVSGFNFRFNKEDAEKIEVLDRDTNMFYRIAIDSQIPSTYQPKEKVRK